MLPFLFPLKMGFKTVLGLFVTLASIQLAFATQSFPKTKDLEVRSCSEDVSGNKIHHFHLKCAVMSYRVDVGSWTSWSSWTACSASCGFGIRNQTRNCFKTNEQDRDCPLGEANKSEPCYLQQCQGILHSTLHYKICNEINK